MKSMITMRSKYRW